MQSTPNSKVADPHDLFVIEPDVVLAARPDKDGPARAADAVRPSRDREVQMGSPAAAPAPAVDATFRATAANGGRAASDDNSLGRWAGSAMVAIALAVCSAVSAAAWQRYGDQAGEMLARLVPHFSMPFSVTDKPAAAGPASTPAAPPAAAKDQPAGTPAAAAEPAKGSEAAAAPASPPAPDSAQALQSISHDLAGVSRQIGELKASIEQLKASQEQLSHEIARISEAKAAEARLAETRLAEAKAAEKAERAAQQRLRQRTSLPRPVSPPLRRPAPVTTMAPPRPAMTSPPAQLQFQPLPQMSGEAQDDPVVRPPMPVR